MARDPIKSVAVLLNYYSFDLGGLPVEQVVTDWLEEYSPKWVLAAVVEAIYQGRYKSASVDNILLNWYLSGRPQHHFDSEFADLVCSKLFKTIPQENQTLPKPAEKTFVKILDAPSRPAPTPEAGTREPYSLSQIQSTSTTFNKGIGQWLKFVTKL